MTKNNLTSLVSLLSQDITYFSLPVDVNVLDEVDTLERLDIKLPFWIKKPVKPSCVCSSMAEQVPLKR